jgi:hypothetical protein
MTDRDTMMGAFRQGVGGIDPILDQAANYTKGVRAVQQVMRQQGEVMSATLSNNHLLYHTNKKLTARLRELEDENESLLRRLDILSQQNTAQAEYIDKLESNGSDRFRALYEDSRRTLELYLTDALTQDQLRQRLGDMKAQADELAKMPDLVTKAELVAMEVETPE